MTEAYFLVKTLHIVSATVLFGVGIGTAAHLLLAHRSGDVRVIAEATRRTVFVDWCATLPAAIVQPATGIALILLAGWQPLALWLVASYALFAFAIALWLIVVVLQLRLREIASAADAHGAALPPAYFRTMRLWVALGWPALFALLTVFWLMVRKPI